MTIMESLTAAPTIGTPVYRRGEVGHVTRVLEASGTWTLGRGGMTRDRAEYEIAFDEHLSVLSDNIIAPWLAEAERMQLAPVSEAEAADKRAAAIAANQDRANIARRQREVQEERAAAFELEAAAKMPASAKAVIVAELHQDDSDSMTDYFNHKVGRVVILAWSTHTRDIFSEMRKAALNFAETADLATAPESAEHREKYSMGGGYYLKNTWRHSTGWSVHKVRLYRGAESVPVGDWSLPTDETVRAVAAVASASAGALRVEEHTHTRKGFQMWIVVLGERVERDEYDRLNEQARTLGGWYSRPWGKTPGGFAFKSEARALEFAGQSTPTDEPPKPGASAPVPAARPNVSAKFREMADAMQGDIDHKFADRRSNTPKQQREAASARLDGYRLQRTQAALRALADHHDAGTVPVELRSVTTKSAVFDLARAEITNSGRYYDAGHETGLPGNGSPSALALWAMTASVGQSERAAHALREKVDALKLARIDGYFPTPAPVAARMLEAARLPDSGTLLEPSAGSGAILDAVRGEEPTLTLIAFERHNSLREVLTLKGYELGGEDFTESDPSLRVDRVVMNPPFENGQDIEHVRRAFGHLKVGGRLVAIMSPGPFYKTDKRSVAFREWFEALGGDHEDIPAGAFKESGTGVASVMVTLDKDA